MAYSVSALWKLKAHWNDEESTRMNAKRMLILALAGCCLVMALSACGQRGPLYLPDKVDQVAEPGPAEEENPEDDEET